MKYLYSILFVFPLAAAAQLPFTSLPDFLKPNQPPAEVLNSTHVTLMENNFRIVETNVVGKSRGFKLLGLITIKPTSHTRAMSRLYEKAHVEVGRPQTLANVVHESSSTYLILFSLPQVTIRADLIEFTDSPADTTTNEVSPVRARLQRRQR